VNRWAVKLRGVLCATMLVTLALASPCASHEIRPAYLEIGETSPGRYSVLWRTPVLSGKRLPVLLRFPEEIRDVREPIVQQLSDSLVERRTIDAGESGLGGKQITFVGLDATITDVLVRVSLLDGSGSTTMVRPSQPWIRITAAPGSFEVVRTYWLHGVEHILLGFDHLLFVVALLLIVRSPRALLLTITAFTLAHSITLALAVLDVVRLPGPPVEAAIALSILLLAVEIVRLGRAEVGLTARWPWVVAFAFGLLHGFGFASALADIGLPGGDVPLALLAFNVGVESGQIAFVAALFATAAVARRFRVGALVGDWTVRTAPHAIGALAAFWLFDRLGRF